MPRTRLLHPGFFSNEVLARLPATTRLLFAGLWLIADREGRLEDRPARIQMAVLPYERHFNTDKALQNLADCGFVTRYGDAEQKWLQVNRFTRYQHPHPREAESVIPPPPEQAAEQAALGATASFNVSAHARRHADALPQREQAAQQLAEPVAQQAAEATPRRGRAGLDPDPVIDPVAGTPASSGSSRSGDSSADLPGPRSPRTPLDRDTRDRARAREPTGVVPPLAAHEGDQVVDGKGIVWQRENGRMVVAPAT